jgi:hypothetical protein
MQILLAENHVCLYLQQGRLQPQQLTRGHQISNEPLVFDFLLLRGLQRADSVSFSRVSIHIQLYFPEMGSRPKREPLAKPRGSRSTTIGL